MSQDIYDQLAMQMYGKPYKDLFPLQQAKVLVAAGEELLRQSNNRN